ncbi:Tripartite tricarboxylate transporter family receptor [Pigmentiphaga humi]|uniref:Tripartite tricarboxylate transporter family receptor n=1 Tax=Pigmentiphaga humi TaxID=2478468 RepID=A0A3P4AY80_9BURK|nr:tripartite tricarboxylate transporter substrate binding protein [Pigmentiphaga humi]VCU68742.1 Tripartite tricarboxylate transporter family receptor [Pigmentiphaga humi]
MFSPLRHTLAAFFSLLPALAVGADFPTRAVTLVVGYPPGGAIDQSARLVASELAKRWGQPVVVDNKPGANGSIAAAAVAGAAPDGYTLLVTATSHNLNKFVIKNLRYDVEKSFTPVALTVEVPNVLVVNAASPYHDLGQLLAALRAKQRPFSYASQGIGGVPHLAGELFKIRTGTEILHVPYKGAAQGMTDLIGGVVDMSFPSPGSVMGYISQGKLRALAVASTERLPQLKNVPTFAEAGVPDYTISTWHGMLAPAGTPPDVVSRINAEVNAVITEPATRQAMEGQGNLPAKPMTPAAFGQKLAKELAIYGDLAQRIDLSGG